MIKVPAIGPLNAKMMIIGEAPGAEEEKQGIPFIGGSGRIGDGILLEAGITREEIYITNLCKFRPPNNDLWRFFVPNSQAIAAKQPNLRGLFPSSLIYDSLQELYEEIEKVKPNVILAYGNYALWALTNCCGVTIDKKKSPDHYTPTGIMKWRGSELMYDPVLPNIKCKVIPALHPAFVMRNWEWRKATIRDVERAIENKDFHNSRQPHYNFLVRPSYEQCMDTLGMLWNKVQSGPTLLLPDIETRAKHIACLGIAWSKLDAVCIPFMCTERLSYWREEEEVNIVKQLYRILKHPNAICVGQNFMYDLQYFARRWGFIIKMYSDTMYTQHVMFPGTPKGLDYLASIYNDFYIYWKDEGKEWDSSIPEEEYWTYNCKDAINTFEIHEKQMQAIDAYGMREQWQYMIDLIEPVLFMMIRGVLRDEHEKLVQHGKLLALEKEREDYFKRALNGISLAKSRTAKPWYRSPKQQAKLFYDYLKLPVQYHRKTGKPTMDDQGIDALIRISPVFSPLLTRIQEYRSVEVFKANFIETELDRDNRWRCLYKIAGPETFRFASEADVFGFGTNLQNISAGTEE